MDAIMNVISTDGVVWMAIGAGIGSCIGAMITFWVAEGIGFREGTIKMQKHYEEMSAQELWINDPEEIAAPEEIVDVNEPRAVPVV